MGQMDGMKDYKFRVVRTFQKCLERQVEEGLRMGVRQSEGCVLLNTKCEWYTPKLVEMVFKQQ